MADRNENDAALVLILMLNIFPTSKERVINVKVYRRKLLRTILSTFNVG